MTRKFLLLIAPALAALLLLLGPALAPARASSPPAPVVKTNVAAPFFCMGGLPLLGSHAVCLHF